MAIKDPAYIYIPPTANHPAAGKTVAVEMEDFKANAKKWKSEGILPATGEQLAPVQRSMEKEIAGDYPVTAAALGGLRGATLGLSDVALKESGLAEGDSLSRLKEANPTSSMTGELGGALLSGGLAAKGVGSLAARLPTTLSRSVATSAGVGALLSGGEELGSQAREGEYNPSDILAQGVKGAGIGAAFPLAGTLASKVGKGALRAGLRGSELGGEAAQYVGRKGRETLSTMSEELGDAVDIGSFAMGLPPVAAISKRIAPKLESLGGRLSSISRKGLSRLEKGEEIGRLSTAIRNSNPGLTRREAKAAAEALRERANSLTTNPLGGTAKAFGNTTGTGGAPSYIGSQFRSDMNTLNAVEEAAKTPITRDRLLEGLKRAMEKEVEDRAVAARQLLKTGR